jgi:hypothetical protein
VFLFGFHPTCSCCWTIGCLRVRRMTSSGLQDLTNPPRAAFQRSHSTLPARLQKVVMAISNTHDDFQRIVYLRLPTACLLSRFTLGILHPSFENKDRQARDKLVLEQWSYSPSHLAYRICILLQILVMAAAERFVLPHFRPIVPKPPVVTLLGYIHVRKYGCDQLKRKYFRG